METACPFQLQGKDVIDLPSQEQQALKTQKALIHLRAYVERCGGTLPHSWDCAVRFRTTTRRNGRLGLTTDNYYYSPCGKTFRTHRQVADFLGLPEPQQEQPQFIVTVPDKQQQISSASTALVPTDPRLRAGMKRTVPSATTAIGVDKLAKRPASSVISSCTVVGVAAAGSSQDVQQVLAPAAAAGRAVATSSMSALSCCSEQQQQPVVAEQSAQSMPPPRSQPLRRTKGSLAAKYADLGSGAVTMRRSVVINTTGSFYDLCFSLVAAGSGSAQALVQQQQHILVRTAVAPVMAVAKPLTTPLMQQQQQVAVRTAVVPHQHGPVQQRTAAASPASSSTSSSAGTTDFDRQTAVADSNMVSLVQQQLQEELLRCETPAAVAAPTISAPTPSTAASSGCGTAAITAVCSSRISRGTFSSSKRSCIQSSRTVAPAIGKQRSSKTVAVCKHTDKQHQQQSPSRSNATKQQQQGPKPWKPRAQPAWRLQLRQLASRIAAENASASSSRVVAAADSAVSGATVQ